MLKHIEIGIIPQDLRQEETIVQIAEALDALDSAVSNIFNCIDERLSQNSKRLTDIKTRAVNLQDQVTHLQTNLSLKAVKIYSAAKYPASHTYKEYPVTVRPSLKHDTKPPEAYKSPVPISQASKSHMQASNQTKNGKHVANENVQEKLQFYHVKTKPRQRSDEKGLGVDRIPPHLSSVSSLLLFNSKDNPYGRPMMHSTQADDKKELEDAPDSILQSWHSMDVESPSNYFYAPTLGEVPLINVPLTLPDLPGIVDDERFVLDLNAQSPIAPSSVVTTPTANLNLPTPPAPHPDEKDSATQDEQSRPNLPNLTEQTVSSSQPSPSHPPPPPPPPPAVPASSPAPPPPPPPPPPAPSVPEPAQRAEKKPAVKVESVDDRSNLMEAIRNAGGLGRAKLRPTGDGEKKAENWSSASVGGDLIADLHAKLSLRRKGISGTMTGALDKISAMIPPPPKPSDAAASERHSAASEQDSQPDTDDWDE